MKQQTVILISGKAGSGKSYYAKTISKQIDNIWIVPFAARVKAPLNKACSSMFGKLISQLTSEEKEQFRPVLQAYGQVGRSISPDYWVDKVKSVIKDDIMENIYVIDDCRFENELNAFDNYNVIKVRLNRTSANKNVNPDSSETGLDHIADDAFDIVVTDKTTDEEFMNKVISEVRRRA